MPTIFEFFYHCEVTYKVILPAKPCNYLVPLNKFTMKIRYLKQFLHNKPGDTNDISDQAANYFIRVGVAEEVADTKEYVEKLELRAPKGKYKEKAENKTGNVPTAKKAKDISMANIKKTK